MRTDKQQILKRIPDGVYQVESEDNGPEWGQTFGEYLKQTRLSDTMPKRGCRKWLNVPPGKAITSNDIAGGRNKDASEEKEIDQEQEEEAQQEVVEAEDIVENQLIDEIDEVIHEEGLKVAISNSMTFHLK